MSPPPFPKNLNPSALYPHLATLIIDVSLRFFCIFVLIGSKGIPGNQLKNPVIPPANATA